VYQRDNVTGRIRPDHIKFPNSIKHTADEIQELGLEVGIYGDAGDTTCGGYAESLGYKDVDAKIFADWGIHCESHPHTQPSPPTYDISEVRQLCRPSTWHDPYRY
jgi:hypothetical protein